MAKRVLWKEGMALSPQHFQNYDRWILEQVHGSSQYGTWNFGYSGVEFQYELLAEAHLQVVRVQGVFPGGETFDSSDLDGNRLTRSFADLFPLDQKVLQVYLGFATPSEGAQNVSSGEGTPYQEVFQESSDFVDGGRRRTVSLSVPNLRLIFEGELQDGLILMPLCRLKRNMQGGVEIDSSYVPPLLAWQCFRPFTTIIGNLISKLKQKHHQICSLQPAMSGDGVGQILLLQQISAMLYELESQQAHPGLHAYELHTLLGKYLGAMSALTPFREKLQPRGYDHFDPSASFQVVFEGLAKILSAEQKSAFSTRRLDKEGATAFVCDTQGLGLGVGKNVFLWVESSSSLEQITTAFEQHVKLAPRSKLQAIIMSAMQGIRLVYQSAPPPGIQPKPGAVFFKVASDSSLWEDLLKEQRLGIYIPQSLGVMSVDLMIESHA